MPYADNPQGPFVDKGVLIDSQEIGVPQSIDQFYYEEGGKAWIFGEASATSM